MNIKELTLELKVLHEELNSYYTKEAELMNKFYDIYPALRNENKTVYVVYYGDSYVVTDIDFSEQKICLESAPYDESNEVVYVAFELFDEIFNEQYTVIGEI